MLQELEIEEEHKELLELYDFQIQEIKGEDKTKYYTDIKGRPLLMTPKIVANLLEAFKNSFTDEEACIYCGISKNTLYRFIEKNPVLGHQKELLKKNPNIKAKLNWIKKMQEEDYQASKDWLERKSKDEFSLKTINDNNFNGKIKFELTKEEEDQQQELLKLNN